MSAETLLHQGWAWVPSLASLQSLCSAVYGDHDLSALQKVVESCPSLTVYALGNPVEYMMLYNWMGPRVPLRSHRIWWKPMQQGEQIVILRDTHHPVTSHRVLANGQPLPLRWSAGPQQASHILLDSATYDSLALHLTADTEGGIAVLDNVLICSPCYPVKWDGWQPAQWSTSNTDVAHTARPDKPRTQTIDDWWDTRRQLQSEIVRQCIQKDTGLLLAFDDMGLIQSDMALATLKLCSINCNHLHRFFEPIANDPSLMVLRKYPVETSATYLRPCPSNCSLPVSCPRGELLHRLCAEEGLYKTDEIRIRNFHTMDDLLLPFGRPYWTAEQTAVQLPPVLQRCGCSSVNVVRDVSARGHFVQFSQRHLLDFIGIHDLIEALSASGPCVPFTSLIVPSLDEIGAVVVAISIHQSVQDVHAVLTALFCYFNPLLLLDEAVSLAVAVCMLVFHDNRTMSPDDLAVCHAWHQLCWRNVIETAPFL